ncbi:hypothetical protein BH11PSE2_BH11PSE2_07230 [soil metagenome]
MSTTKYPEAEDRASKPKDNESVESVGSGASADDVEQEHDPHTDKQLDHGLKETFPASDPVSINPGAD